MRTTTAKTLSLAAISLLLLTGCQAEAEPSATSASASASVTASASTTHSASANVSAGTTPEGDGADSPEASEGEYRPANEHGPAQNVPVPVEPEGMNVESEDGLFKFLGYWNQTVNYGIETGDFSKAKALVASDYTNEQNIYTWIGEIYNRGGWVVGGRREIALGENNLFAKGQGEYSWLGYLPIEDMQPHLNGPGNITDSSQTQGREVYFDVKYAGGKWEIQSITVAELTE